MKKNNTTYRIESKVHDLEKLFSELDGVSTNEEDSDNGYETWRVISFREEILRQMKKHKISRTKIAFACEISPGSVNSYLSGKSDMMGENIEKMFNYLRGYIC
jgi:hypothetical protein